MNAPRYLKLEDASILDQSGREVSDASGDILIEHPEGTGWRRMTGEEFMELMERRPHLKKWRIDRQ
jgi:hypothetical protein